MHTIIEEAERRYLAALLRHPHHEIDEEPDLSCFLDSDTRDVVAAVRSVRDAFPDVAGLDLCCLAAERCDVPGVDAVVLGDLWADAQRYVHMSDGYARAIRDFGRLRGIVEQWAERFKQGDAEGETVEGGESAAQVMPPRGLGDLVMRWLSDHPEADPLDCVVSASGEKEMVLVAAMLHNSGQAAALSRVMAPEEFGDERCRRAFKYLCETAAVGTAVSDLDLIVVVQSRFSLDERDRGASAEDAAFAAALLDQRPHPRAVLKAITRVAGREAARQSRRQQRRARSNRASGARGLVGWRRAWGRDQRRAAPSVGAHRARTGAAARRD